MILGNVHPALINIWQWQIACSPTSLRILRTKFSNVREQYLTYAQAKGNVFNNILSWSFILHLDSFYHKKMFGYVNKQGKMLKYLRLKNRHSKDMSKVCFPPDIILNITLNESIVDLHLPSLWLFSKIPVNLTSQHNPISALALERLVVFS